MILKKKIAHYIKHLRNEMQIAGSIRRKRPELKDRER
jgi:DNA polymerase/3'-5' exonuclease PolX